MASLTEVDTRSADNRDRILLIEQWQSSVQSNTVPLPKGEVDVNDASIADKTGWMVRGVRAGIHGTKFFVGLSSVADPTTPADISHFTHREL